MYKMKRIGIKGFRRLLNVELEIRPLMVMIGANGVGKTSVLDAFSLLSASAAGELNPTLNDMGGLGTIVTGGLATTASTSVDMEVPGYKPLKYDIHLASQRQSYAISEETLTQEIEHLQTRLKEMIQGRLPGIYPLSTGEPTTISNQDEDYAIEFF